MKKILLFLLILFLPLTSFALEYPSLHYKNAIVYDLTDNKILYELNSTEKSSIASLTKLMTIITAIENNTDLNKTITYTQEMSDNVAWYASKTGFKVGQQLTFDDLLYGAMLPSGADATVALAITTSGSLTEFIKLMNKTANKIGMTNTNFVNVHGLDEENHYSTAEDIKKLLEYALKNTKFKEIYTTKEYTLSTGTKILSTVQKQSNNYNFDISKIKGSKTGYTDAAGLCISILMTHEDHEIILITLNAPVDGTPYNITDGLELINFIESNYSTKTLVQKETIIKTVPVINSKLEKYNITSSNDVDLFLENNYDESKLEIKYEGLEELSYKNTKDELLGTISYYYDNELISTKKAYLTTNIEPDYLKILLSYKKIIITVSVLLIVFIFILILYLKKRRQNKKH